MIILKLSVNSDNVQTAIAFFTMQEVIKKHGIHDLQLQLQHGVLTVYSTDNNTKDLTDLIEKHTTCTVWYANYDNTSATLLSEF